VLAQLLDDELNGVGQGAWAVTAVRTPATRSVSSVRGRVNVVVMGMSVRRIDSCV
jgi:hypothetical protein